MGGSIRKLKNGNFQVNDSFTAELLKYVDKISSITIAEKFNHAITLGEDIRVNSAILLPIAKPNKTPKLKIIRPVCIVPILR